MILDYTHRFVRILFSCDRVEEHWILQSKTHRILYVCAASGNNVRLFMLKRSIESEEHYLLHTGLH